MPLCPGTGEILYQRWGHNRVRRGWVVARNAYLGNKNRRGCNIGRMMKPNILRKTCILAGLYTTNSAWTLLVLILAYGVECTLADVQKPDVFYGYILHDSKQEMLHWNTCLLIKMFSFPSYVGLWLKYEYSSFCMPCFSEVHFERFVDKFLALSAYLCTAVWYLWNTNNRRIHTHTHIHINVTSNYGAHITYFPNPYFTILHTWYLTDRTGESTLTMSARLTL